MARKMTKSHKPYNLQTHLEKVIGYIDPLVTNFLMVFPKCKGILRKRLGQIHHDIVTTMGQVEKIKKVATEKGYQDILDIIEEEV